MNIQGLIYVEITSKLVKIKKTVCEIENLLKQYTENETKEEIDIDNIYESDVLRWILVSPNKKFLELALVNLHESYFVKEKSKKVFESMKSLYLSKQSYDILSVAIDLESGEYQEYLSEIIKKKINHDRADICFRESLERMLGRNWSKKREEIRDKIQSGKVPESEVMEILKEFDYLTRNTPKIMPAGINEETTRQRIKITP